MTDVVLRHLPVLLFVSAKQYWSTRYVVLEYRLCGTSIPTDRYSLRSQLALREELTGFSRWVNGVSYIPFLLISLAIVVDHIHEILNARVGHFHILIDGILPVIKRGVAFCQTGLYVGRYKEGGTVAEVGIKLGEVDVDTSQVEIAEMHIPVGDAKQPLPQIRQGILGITTDKQQPLARQ